jgi:4-phosphopantoate--beta-alanine ligase
MNKIPNNHPRYLSLIIREKISDALKKGLVHETGLIAHGRGEAFDYLLGEKTISYAFDSAKVAAAYLLKARNPVISINGNVVALAAKECISLANSIPAKLEVNLFHRTDERVLKIIDELISNGAKKVYGKKVNAKIPFLDHDRALCEKDGIFSSDVVLVSLEDGDRCEALVNMGKIVIAIDLNPLSRTAKKATVTIVDNVIRAIPNINEWFNKLKLKNKNFLENIIKNWDNKEMLKKVNIFISKRLNSLF